MIRRLRECVAEFIYYRLCCRGPLALRIWMNKVLRAVCPKAPCKCGRHSVTVQPFSRFLVAEQGEWIVHSAAACAGWDPPWPVAEVA